MSIKKSAKGFLVNTKNRGLVLIRHNHKSSPMTHEEALNLLTNWGSYIDALAKNGNPGVDPGFKVLRRA